MYEYGKYWSSWDSTKEYESFREAQAAMKERCEKKVMTCWTSPSEINIGNDYANIFWSSALGEYDEQDSWHCSIEKVS